MMRWLAAALVLAAATAPAGAQDTGAPDGGDAERGREIVELHCAECHAIDADGASLLAEAPPFTTFAQMWPVEHLAEALAEGITVGHGGSEMPEFVFQPEEIGDIIAYLQSISEE